MSTWKVQTTYGAGPTLVDADGPGYEAGGILAFYKLTGRPPTPTTVATDKLLVKAFAPGAWLTVEMVVEADG